MSTSHPALQVGGVEVEVQVAVEGGEITVPEAARSPSICEQIRDTSDFEMPVSQPRALTRRATLREETAFTSASMTTA